MGSPRILVADDDAWILRMVSTVLAERGYDVEAVADGEEAYERALDSLPDLLITDVMMPKVDGWTLVRALRSKPQLAFMPVIFLTALSSDDDRIRGFRLGADDYMPKPFRFEELDLRVARVLRNRELIESRARELVGGDAPAATAALAGNLEHVGLSALLGLLEMERKSGILILTRDSAVGRLFFRDGRVVTAALDGEHARRNRDCIYHLLRWSRGVFEFTQSEVEIEDEIGATTTHLLMEAARLFDEERAEPR